MVCKAKVVLCLVVNSVIFAVPDVVTTAVDVVMTDEVVAAADPSPVSFAPPQETKIKVTSITVRSDNVNRDVFFI